MISAGAASQQGLVLIEPAPRQARNLRGDLVLAVLNRVRPIRPEHEFEPSGNYVFKLSIADVQQMLLGIGLRCFAYTSINVSIETESQYCDGRTVVDRWLVTDRPHNAHAGIDVDAQRFLELLVSRIATLG